MDGQRFDRWTQTLARKLRQGTGTERQISMRPLDQPAPQVASAPPVAHGTCAYQGPTTAGSGRDGQGGAQPMGICGWEHLPALPASNQDAPSTRTNRSARRQRAQPLSAREQEIAGLIGQGLRDREIAAALVVSEHTVHAHVRNLLDKLGLASRTQIAAWVATRTPDDQSSLPREQAEP